MSSYQITGIQQDVWKAFRRMCLEEGISANCKIKELIATEVMEAEGRNAGTKDTSKKRGLANEGQ